ncbi:nuclear transport factor 2 family protein [Streptomyces sp. NPDC001843]|uniref:nuclear transport factor 2 family protein n=1 Tax=Streptomyces sp. NPDC001843 TaxID=3364617 RepID=UPI0036BE07A7
MATPTTVIRSAESLVTQLFSIIDAARWDDLGRVFAEDCVYDRPGYEPLRGLRRIERFYRMERVVAAGRHQVLHIVSDLEAAACWGRFTGTSRTGDCLDEQFADTYTVRDGRIVGRRTYFYRPAI